MDATTDGAVDESAEARQPSDAGFMRFYGLYWDRQYIFTNRDHQVLPGVPTGWTGKGRIARDADRDAMWMNFWDQKGVYVLYDRDLDPVYSGQAGLKRGGDGRCLGERLREHIEGKYRNGWSFFSWFGFLECASKQHLEKRLRDSPLELRRDPGWYFNPPKLDGERPLNLILDSFEAILIEAFVPRFNSRGGNLKGATYVDQFESIPRFIQNERNGG